MSHHHNRVRAAIRRSAPALLLALATIACDTPGRAAPPSADAATRGFRAEHAPAAVAQAPAPELKGAFRVAYPAAKDATFAEWRNDYRNARFLEGLAEWLNGWIALPSDITLVMGECGEPNSFYEPKDREVIVCYELVEDLDGMFSEEEDPGQAVDDALVFTALHEVGHALVDVLDLPVTGREEDAVDQLAAIVLADGSDEGDAAAINGVRGLPAEEVLDDTTFADEHALSGQRYYNVLCLVYGQDPDAYAAWLSDGTLPRDRADRCQEEYEHASSAWNRLLEPYLKESPKS
ncbi:MAG TPA: DUF4344 domain-containing metallopeptidase [Longimicrobium sp.]|nr:DUF4344 domain-containing metallopeptidase [Longimicrobium sp.]